MPTLALWALALPARAHFPHRPVQAAAEVAGTPWLALQTDSDAQPLVLASLDDRGFWRPVAPPPGVHRIQSLAELDGSLLVVADDGGLWQRVDERWSPLDLELQGAVAVFDGESTWIGGEEGVYVLGPEGRASRESEASVSILAAHERLRRLGRWEHDAA